MVVTLTFLYSFGLEGSPLSSQNLAKYVYIAPVNAHHVD